MEEEAVGRAALPDARAHLGVPVRLMIDFDSLSPISFSRLVSLTTSSFTVSTSDVFCASFSLCIDDCVHSFCRQSRASQSW